MKTLQKADSIFKWIILGLTVVNIISYFLPIYDYIYYGSSRSEHTLCYLYGSNSSYVVFSFSSLLIPIIAIVFMFANFKNSRLFFFGLSAAYIISCIFTILSVSHLSNYRSDYYRYSLEYGFYIFIVTVALLSIAIIGSFVVYLLFNRKDSKLNNKDSKSDFASEPPQQTAIDVLRKRIEVLDDLKKQNILTESEYEQKRSEIVKEIKI